MILLDDNEIEVALLEALRLSWAFRSHPRFEREKYMLRIQTKKIADWGNGVCSHGTSIDGADFIMQPRRKCDKCWLELLEEEV